MVTDAVAVKGTHATSENDVAALGEDFERTPMVVPTRGHLDPIRRFMKGDLKNGRGSRQRKLLCSRYCDNYKVAEVGRAKAISLFRQHLCGDKVLYGSLWTLSGRRLVYRCKPTQCCHGDVLIEEFVKSYLSAHNRKDLASEPPSAEVLDFVARLREEPESESESSPDEGVPGKRAGHLGDGDPMLVGVYTTREYCDGQSLASPGRWAPESRKYPTNPAWLAVASLYQAFAETYGTESLLVSLALGRVKEPPFEAKAVQELKASAIEELHGRGMKLERKTGDREDVPIDYRDLDLLLRVSGDPEVGIVEYVQGIRVGPAVRMPRLPALYKQKKRWCIPEQADPLDYLECSQEAGVTWKRSYSSLDQWKDKALEVLHDQAARGQVLELPEHEARRKCLDLVVASLGAIRKDKPNGRSDS